MTINGTMTTKGQPATHRKLPTRTAVKVIRDMFAIADEAQLSYRAISQAAGISYMAFGSWKAGKHSPGINDFENVLQVLGYRIRLEKVER